jgi:hypothetical protein
MTPRDEGALPAPLTPEACNLQDFAFMPLDVARLRDSDMAAYQSPESCWAAVLLWSAAWHQVPAASLPDDDRFLAKAAGYGRVVKEWMNVREGALHGWIKCADGRLYHPVVAEKALESWRAKVHHQWKKECDRIRKSNKQRESEGKPLLPLPPEPGSTSDNLPAENLGIPPEKVVGSNEIAESFDGIPPENPLKGQGEGQGQGQGELKTNPSSSSQASTEVGADQQRDDDDQPRESKRAIAIAAGLRESGIEATTGDAIVLAWASDPRVTKDVLTLAIDRARKFKPGEAIGLVYLDKAVQSILQRQSAPAMPPPAIAQPFQRAPQGNEPKGLDESYEDWQARVDAFERAQRNGGKAA